MNVLWTSEEKEKFFTALARCSRGNLLEISQRIGSKSLAEVTAYVGLLEEESQWTKRGTKRRKLFDFRDVPAAVEVDENWLEFEEEMAGRVARKGDIATEGGEDEEEEDMALNIEMANELAGWYLPS